MRRVVVLGSTGSIGIQALDVISHSRASDDPLRLVGVAAGSSWQALLAQASGFDVGAIYLDAADAAVCARDAVAGASSAMHVAGSIGELLDRSEPDLVLNAIVGASGLESTLAALERGIDVALANKESLVAAGELCLDAAERTGAAIIPVDSEHSALQQCIGSSTPEEVTSLVLTASGGPFRGRTRAELADVDAVAALAHPTWSMGGKISIDSATLMNKGLELIEAMTLFDVSEEDVEIVVHRDSIVHALVRHRDGSLLAHLGWPDMRVPIAWGLHWPVRPPVEAARTLDLVDMPPLIFEQPDPETFICLALARAAARAGGGTPCVLNAANEVAVHAFLDGQVGFLDIADIVEAVLGEVDAGPAPGSLEAALELDQRARTCAMGVLTRHGR